MIVRRTRADAGNAGNAGLVRIRTSAVRVAAAAAVPTQRSRTRLPSICLALALAGNRCRCCSANTQIRTAVFLYSCHGACSWIAARSILRTSPRPRKQGAFSDAISPAIPPPSGSGATARIALAVRRRLLARVVGLARELTARRDSSKPERDSYTRTARTSPRTERVVESAVVTG